MLLAFALAVLATFAVFVSAQQTVLIPWVERPATGYNALHLNCSDVARFKWGPEKHEVYQTHGRGCSAPKVKEFFEGPNGDVSVYFSYPGTYNYVCKVGDHCTKGKQLIDVKVGSCGAPNTLAWTYRRDNSTYAPVTVPCGTNITFAWTLGRHDVVQVDKPNCNATVIKAYGEPVAAPGNTTVEFTQPGSFHYLCGVPNHCSVGKMLVTVHVVPSLACGMPPPKPRAQPPPRRRPPPTRRPPPMRFVRLP